MSGKMKHPPTPEELNAQAGHWFQDPPKPIDDFTLEELRVMAWDPVSPFHRGRYAKVLQTRYTALVTAQPAAPKSTEVIMGNGLKNFVDKCAVWMATVQNVSPERLTDPSFWSVVEQKLHLGDEIRVRDTLRREWTEILVDGHPGSRTYVVLRKVLLPAAPEVDDVSVPGHSIAFDEETSRWDATRVRDGVKVVVGAGSRRECLRQLQDHPTLRGERTPNYSTAQQ